MQYCNPYIESCIEGSLSVFRGIDHEARKLLDNNHSFICFRKGEFVIREGEKTRGISIMVSGRAKLFRTGVGNREQIIRLLKPPSVINYNALFSETHSPFSCRTFEESVVVVIDKTSLVKLLRQNGDLALRFMKLISDDLIFTNNRLVSLTQKHVRGRLAESLILIRDTYGLEADGRTLRAVLPREDIAHLSNMTTSNAIRTLSNFEAEKIIDLAGKRIIIRDAGKLEETSRSGQ